MKQILCFAGMLLLFSACKKMDCCSLQPSPFFMIAQKNGASWRADTASASLNNDTITITGDIPDVFLNSGPWPETLRFKVKNNGPGTYRLPKNQVFYVTQFGPDAVPSFQLFTDTLYNNTLTITRFDQAGHVISGTFDLKFVNNYNPSNIGYISFSAGQFNEPLH